MSDIDHLNHLLDQVVVETLRKADELGVKKAQSTDLFKVSQGFKDKIITQPAGKSSQVVWSTAPYSSYLEDGNNQGGPFIYPTNAKALRFSMNGETVFYKKVKSHGPLPFMANAEAEVDSQIDNIWEAVKKDVLK